MTSSLLRYFWNNAHQYQATDNKKGSYPFAQSDGVVPASDGAGIVEAVGSKVHRFKAGDKVVTIFNQGHLSGSVDSYSVTTGTGGVVDGALQQYGAYNEEGLVHLPSQLNFLEGATLTCAGVTAWNALYGLKRLMPGDYVLTQGTGGVSIFAVQVSPVHRMSKTAVSNILL